MKELVLLYLPICKLQKFFECGPWFSNVSGCPIDWITEEQKLWNQFLLELVSLQKILEFIGSDIELRDWVETTTLYNRRHDTEHNDAQHNDVQHNDAQHNDAQHNDVQLIDDQQTT